MKVRTGNLTLSILTLALKRERVRVSTRAGEECKKKKDRSTCVNSLFFFVEAKGIEPSKNKKYERSKKVKE